MFTDRSLLGLILTDLVLVVNQNLAGTMITYVYNDYFKNSSVMAIAMVVNTATVILLSPFSHYIASHFGRRNSSIVGLIISCSSNWWWFWWFLIKLRWLQIIYNWWG